MSDFVIRDTVLEKYTGSDAHVIIPEGVTEIGSMVFFGRSSIQSVVIPEGVTEIGTSAFSNCSGLKSVVIPEGVTEIGMNAFNNCSGLKSVVIPKSLTRIESTVFADCNRLEHVVIPEGVTEIGMLAFSGCSGLQRVVIPEGVTEIEMNAFRGCSSLQSVVIPEGVTEIGMSAFADCNSLERVVVLNGISYIGWSAFSGCINLKSIELPESLTSIGSSAFSGCINLKSIELPEGLTSIGSSAFSGCINLGNVAIPNSVTHVAKNAFQETLWLKNQGDVAVLNGVLLEYRVSDANLTIPSGVRVIGDAVFAGCERLQSVVMPESVTHIGNEAFSYCKNLQSVEIPESVVYIDGLAFSSCENLQRVVIPESVTYIGDLAFSYCKNLQNAVISEGVMCIGRSAFSECDSLQSIVIPKSVESIGDKAFCACNSLARAEILGNIKEAGCSVFAGCKSLIEVKCANTDWKIPGAFFGWKLPEGIKKNVSALLNQMSNEAIVDYVVNDKSIFKNLDQELQTDIVLNMQGKKLFSRYKELEVDWDSVAGCVVARIHDQYSAKECNAVAALMINLVDKFSACKLQAMYAALEPLKKAAKAKKSIADCSALLKVLDIRTTSDRNYTGVAKTVVDIITASGKTLKEFEVQFNSMYGMQMKELPGIKDKSGNDVETVVFAWLLSAHEKLEKDRYYSDKYKMAVAWENVGICPDAARVLEELDHAVFMDVIRLLAQENLGIRGYSKRMYLAYPICRYADESLMEELTRIAPSWKSSVSGDHAPALYTFRMAAIYSESRAAFYFAEKYSVPNNKNSDLEKYARIRGTDADSLRDRYLSGIDVDAQGGKAYDLGNQVVTARLQNDLSFLVELPGGKTAKSLPKKGADAEKYAAANADFTRMKKDAKEICKKRIRQLFADFIDGRRRDAQAWSNVYLNNRLLYYIARLLVWGQGKNTFTIAESGPITVNGNPYAIGKENIFLAHPMEMDPAELAEWQKYFTSRSLKQPFEQIWEPVADPKTLKKNRYAGFMIPYYRFVKQEKHGIYVEDEDFHNEITIWMDDCNVSIKRIDWERHTINMHDCFEIKEFAFGKYTRQVNHLVAYLDRITVYDRVSNDDISIAELLPGFTLAQITEFINVAVENNCTNVSAILLDYKNRTFADFDPMDAFSLEW